MDYSKAKLIEWRKRTASICWDCTRRFGDCSWSYRFIVPEGAVAEAAETEPENKVMIKIVGCPEFSAEPVRNTGRRVKRHDKNTDETDHKSGSSRILEEIFKNVKTKKQEERYLKVKSSGKRIISSNAAKAREYILTGKITCEKCHTAKPPEKMTKNKQRLLGCTKVCISCQVENRHDRNGNPEEKRKKADTNEL